MGLAHDIRRDEAERRKAIAAADRIENDPGDEMPETPDAPPATPPGDAGQKDNATDPRRTNKQRRGPAENK